MSEENKNPPASKTSFRKLAEATGVTTLGVATGMGLVEGTKAIARSLRRGASQTASRESARAAGAFARGSRRFW